MMRASIYRFILIVLVGGLSATDQVLAQETLHQATISFDLSDLAGNVHRLSQNDLVEPRVFVFLSTTCPISNSYTKELNRLSAALPAGVKLYGVVSDPFVSRGEAAKHFTTFQLATPILFDASGLLADLLQPTHVPEAFVLDADSAIVYCGAIDNAYESIGRRRVNVEAHYLRDAILAVANGNKPANSSTTPIGCHFPKAPTGNAATNVTFTRDVAPILFSRCVTCHRPGQVAPFSLTEFADAASHSAMMVEVTSQRIMPPWMPGPETESRFVGERKLTSRELDILKVWHDAGCPEGNLADLPPIPPFADGWQLGTPDLIVKMQQPFTVPADGPDSLQNFVIPLDVPADKLVAAVEFHPGNKRVVHHAVLFLDDKNQARKLDAATNEPGYSNFGGPGFLPSGSLGGWSVGNTARRLPNEMGRYLKRGSDLVVQVHYHPTGKEELDQSELGLYFVPKPVEESLQQSAKLVGSIWMANYEMDIPAGADDYRRSTTYIVPKNVILVGVVPHMHLLGKSMHVTATFPNGKQQTLIDVPRWDYNWQDEYYLERTISLPANTRLEVSATFDNSAANPSNPSSPPKRVTWGEETTNEMLYCFFLLTAENAGDLIHVIFDNLAHDAKQTRASLADLD